MDDQVCHCTDQCTNISMEKIYILIVLQNLRNKGPYIYMFVSENYLIQDLATWHPAESLSAYASLSWQGTHCSHYKVMVKGNKMHATFHKQDREWKKQWWTVANHKHLINVLWMHFGQVTLYGTTEPGYHCFRLPVWHQAIRKYCLQNVSQIVQASMC